SPSLLQSDDYSSFSPLLILASFAFLNHFHSKSNLSRAEILEQMMKSLVFALPTGSEFLNLKIGFRCRGIRTSYENVNEVINKKGVTKLAPS
ncbi:hypothetical protein PIB30_094915, partial [Stylosanthes scabra]|nr:hypothetical protein [Stylosanthes scabra]